MQAMLRGWRLPDSEPYSWETFRADARSGVTMLATGLPSGMALGVASGMGALAGLYCVVIVGFFAALFGGTRAQSSGPSAAIAVMVAVVRAYAWGRGGVKGVIRAHGGAGHKRLGVWGV
ncbi:MAG: hypothetical protein F4Y03_07935 [Alphaproteobacteria bacterium]|nr:hypothetical protein [Alphaproteobacteria bacterium]